MTKRSCSPALPFTTLLGTRLNSQCWAWPVPFTDAIWVVLNALWSVRLASFSWFPKAKRPQLKSLPGHSGICIPSCNNPRSYQLLNVSFTSLNIVATAPLGSCHSQLCLGAILCMPYPWRPSQITGDALRKRQSSAARVRCLPSQAPEDR